MDDQMKRTHSSSSQVSTTRATQSSAASTARKVGAWTYYGLFGVWIRLVVAVALIGCGLALLFAFPLALLQRAGAFSIQVLHLGSWLEQQSNGAYYLAAGLGSVIGAFLLYLAFGSARRWLLRRPAA
jgi:hypothetical protein